PHAEARLAARLGTAGTQGLRALCPWQHVRALDPDGRKRAWVKPEQAHDRRRDLLGLDLPVDRGRPDHAGGADDQRNVPNLRVGTAVLRDLPLLARVYDAVLDDAPQVTNRAAAGEHVAGSTG